MSDKAAAYLDAEGRPRLELSIVAFFDILGFSQMSTSCATTDQGQMVLDRIVAAIDESRQFVRDSFPAEAGSAALRWGIKFFSDNLALGYPVDGFHHDLAAAALFIIRCAQRYQLAMSNRGFFLRGGLTHGPICLTDDIIFGSALVECYHLESKASIVPRVILAEPLRQILLEHHRAATSPVGPENDAICRDVDGWWFVNYLQAACNGTLVQWKLVESHKASILESLSHATRHEVLPKYGWACRYHNLFCHWHRDSPGYSDRFRIDRSDEQSTMIRLCDMGEA
jgi:hypothetical protein